MKKIMGVLLAVVFVFGMTVSAQAAGGTITIEAPTNPGIPLGACHQMSEIQLGFEGNTVLRVGDTGKFDLQLGATLCQDVDFFIGNAVNGLLTGGIVATSVAPVTFGPLEIHRPTSTNSVGGIYMRVQGVTGSQTVQVTILGAAGSFLIVGGGNDDLGMDLNLFGRGIWSQPSTAGNFATTKFATNTVSAILFQDADNDGDVDRTDTVTVGGGGKTSSARIWTTTLTNKNNDNAVCIQPSLNFTGTDVNVFFDSQDVLNPGVKAWTFTNDPGFSAGDNYISVAHILPAESLQCILPCKGDDWGYVEIGTITQGSTPTCDFNYNPAATGYCTLPTSWTGQYITIKKNSVFEPGDYEIVLSVSATSVWFDVDAGPGVMGFAPGTPDANICAGTGGTTVNKAPVFLLGNGMAATTTDVNDCDVSANGRAVSVVIPLMNISPYSILRIAVPGFVYNSADVVNGDEVFVDVVLNKLPCGKLFECLSNKVAEFGCPTAAAAVTQDCFTFPYFPSINDAVWWNGGAFANCSSGEATCTLNFYESDGDSGALTLTIGAWGAWSGLWSSVSASIVANAANTGSLGDATFFICACCSPGTGGPGTSATYFNSPVSAIGMMGTGNQAHGYDLNNE
jgi:hypothetical protein